MLHNNNIQIAILEVSDQNKAVLEFYFNSVGEDFYNLVNKDQADVFIYDNDYPDAKAGIEQALKANLKPIVIISAEEPNLPSTIWLKQPLSAAEITVLSEKIRPMIKVFAERKAESDLEISANTSTENNNSDFVETGDIAPEDTELESSVVKEPTKEAVQKETIQKEVIKEETLPKEVIEEEAVESSEENEANDFFEFLEETNQSNAENQNDVVKETAKTQSSASADTSLNTNSKSSVDSDLKSNKEDSILDVLFQDELSETEKSLVSKDSLAFEESSTIKQSSTFKKSSTVDESSKPEKTSTVEEQSIKEEILSIDETEKAEDLNKIDNQSKLTFSNVDIDVQSDDENHTKEVESEVDALLKSLISDSDDVTEEPELNRDAEADHSNDLFLEKLVIDPSEDLIEKFEDSLVNKEVIIEAEIAEEKAIADLTDFVDEELNSKLDKESEDEAVKKDKSLIIEESFTIHNEQNPSLKSVFSDTLQVNYADLKTKNKQLNSNPTEDTLIEVEDFSEATKVSEVQDDESTQKENGLNAVALDKLEDDLFEFELESNTSEASDVSEIIPSLTVIETVDKSKSNQNPDVELDKGIDLDIDTDLDSLLKEVAIEDNSEKDVVENSTDDLVDKLIDSNEKLLGIPNTSSIDEDFTNPAGTDLDVTDSADFELQSLLNEVRQEAGKGGQDRELGADGKYSKAIAYNKTEAEKRWIQLCGDISDISQQKEVDKISYNFKNHLLNALLEQLESTEDSEKLFRMKYKDLIVVIDHSKNKIYCNIPTTNDDYAAVCFSEIDPLDIKIHDLDYSEIRLYRKKIKENTNRAHSIESFIWTTSLLTSQGRLPQGTEIKKTISLKVWPDLTRVELMPHAMNIAAVLSKHPGSLLEIPKWLNIPQRYVFAFYNATLALDMIELDSNNHNKPSRFDNKNTNKKSDERGVFGRLFRRSK